MEEKSDKSIDLDINAVQQELETPEDDNNESMDNFKIQLEEIYKSRVSFVNAVNQVKKRRVNLALIIIQFFSRYNVTQTIGFLTAATVLVVLQVVSAFVGSFSHSALYLGILMTILMAAFVIVTLKNVFSALTDIKRIKQGFCSLGYQIVEKNDNDDESSDNFSIPPTIAYKDNVNMIRTLKIPGIQYKKYFIAPVLALFLDNGNPYKVTFFDEMPRYITYEYKSQTFIQEWKDAICALIPCAMTVLFAISMYMSYIAYTMLHQ